MLNESQIGDIWMLFADYIDKKQVEVAAERYIDLLADYGISDKVYKTPQVQIMYLMRQLITILMNRKKKMPAMMKKMTLKNWIFNVVY